MDKSYLLIALSLLFAIGLSGLFKKAGEKSWKAFVPFLNIYVWLKIVQRPKWWLLLSIIPVVNIVLFIGLTVELLNCFGKRKITEHLIGTLFGFAYLPYLAFFEKANFTGVVDYSKTKKSKPREWSEAIFFAVIAATIIRTFGLEAFKIPSPSMESTLMTGDFLFVSKFHYGARTPQTPLSIPFTHQVLPVLGIQSYLDWIQLPSFKLPGLKDVERRDIIVFNYPYEPYRPIDKKTNYVKRCVAIPGDTLEVKKGIVYIDGIKEEFPKKGHEMPHPDYTDVYPPRFSLLRTAADSNLPAWTNYDYGSLWMPKKGVSIPLNEINYYKYNRIFKCYESQKIYFLKELAEGYTWLSDLKAQRENINTSSLDEQTVQFIQTISFHILNFNLTSQLPIKMHYLADRFYIRQFNLNESDIRDLINAFNEYTATGIDDELHGILEEIKKFDPSLVKNNLPDKDAIVNYLKQNKPAFRNDKDFVKTYTFENNYYFAMGDNRPQSADSRSWGFIPESHILGTPVFVWMSINNGIQFDRLFCFVSANGLSQSYLFHFLIGGLLLWFGNKLWKNKKNKNQEVK